MSSFPNPQMGYNSPSHFGGEQESNVRSHSRNPKPDGTGGFQNADGEAEPWGIAIAIEMVQIGELEDRGAGISKGEEGSSAIEQSGSRPAHANHSFCP